MRAPWPRWRLRGSPRNQRVRPKAGPHINLVRRLQVGLEQVGIYDGIRFALACAPNVRGVKRHTIDMLWPEQTVRSRRHKVFERAWIHFGDGALLVAQKAWQSGVIGSGWISDVDGLGDGKASRSHGCALTRVAMMEVSNHLLLEGLVGPRW